jgi:hypothetical protein
MSGFTKLVPEIVLSSIWNESPEVRCVWIALLATKDKDGNVRGNVRSLARVANVPVEAVDESLDIFQRPDPDSNNPDSEGRRIEAIPGGWHIVSHDIYRAKDYREHEAERKQAWRKNRAMSGTSPGQVPDCSVSVSASPSVSEQVAEGDARGSGNTCSTPVQRVPPLKTFKTWTEADLAESAKAANSDGTLAPSDLAEFLAYWSEPCPSGRPRMSKQAAWDTRRRIQTWRRNKDERATKQMSYGKPNPHILKSHQRMNMTGEQIAAHNAKYGIVEEGYAPAWSTDRDGHRQRKADREYPEPNLAPPMLGV